MSVAAFHRGVSYQYVGREALVANPSLDGEKRRAYELPNDRRPRKAVDASGSLVIWEDMRETVVDYATVYNDGKSTMEHFIEIREIDDGDAFDHVFGVRVGANRNYFMPDSLRTM